MTYIIIDYSDISRHTFVRREVSLSRRWRFLRKKSRIECYRWIRILWRCYVKIRRKVVGSLKSLKIYCIMRNFFIRRLQKIIKARLTNIFTFRFFLLLLKKSKFYRRIIFITSTNFSLMLRQTSSCWRWSFRKITHHILLCRIQRTQRMGLNVSYLGFLGLDSIVGIEDIFIELRIFMRSIF